MLALAALLVSPPRGIAQGPPALPPLDDAMYDAALPPRAAVRPWPNLCPPLPLGRIVQAPTPGGRLECPEHYEAIAADILDAYETSPDHVVRSRAADVLGQLWLAQRLNSDIKARILDHHYRVDLVQVLLSDDRLELHVFGRSAFPFPPVTFNVRSAVYRNGRAQLVTLVDGLNWTTLLPERRLASYGAGGYVPGDVYVVDIVLDEDVDRTIVWRKVLRTGAVVVE